jgi:hypothetical protein
MKWRVSTLFLVLVTTFIFATHTFAELTTSDVTTILNRYKNSGAYNDTEKGGIIEAYIKSLNPVAPTNVLDLIRIIRATNSNDLFYSAYEQLLRSRFVEFKNETGDSAVSSDRLEVYALEDLTTLLNYAAGASTNIPAELDGSIAGEVKIKLFALKNGKYTGFDGKVLIEKQIALVTQLKSNADARDLQNAGVLTPEQAQERKNAAAREAAKGVAAAGAPDKSQFCSFSFNPVAASSFNLFDCVDFLSAWFIKTFLLQFGSYFTWIGAQFFHLGFYYGVYKFADIMGGSSGAAANMFYGLWVVIKSLVNFAALFFVIGLIIMYLLDREADVKRAAIWILLYALFVNFSWTATRVVVDESNIITLNLYEAAVPGALGTRVAGADLAQNAQTVLMGNTAADLIMNKLGLQSLFGKINDTASNVEAKLVTSRITSTPVALLFVILSLYTAYIFLVMALIFIARTGLLMLFIIGSPFLLLDAVLPYVGGYVKRARVIFFSQLIVGIVFMLFFYVIIRVMEGIRTNVLAIPDTMSDGGPTISLFFGVIFMLVLLTVMLKAVRSLSKEAGGFVDGIAGKAMMLAGGGTALLGRATIGAGAARLAQSGLLDKMQGSAIGRGLKASASRVAGSTFDLRNVAIAQSVAKAGGVQLGKGATRTYEASQKEATEYVEKTASGIKDEAARSEFINSLRGNLAYGIANEGKRIADEYTRKQYDKAKPEDRQRLFRDQTDSDLRENLVEEDRKAALEENKVRQTRKEENAKARTEREEEKDAYDKRKVAEKEARDIAAAETRKREQENLNRFDVFKGANDTDREKLINEEKDAELKKKMEDFLAVEQEALKKINETNNPAERQIIFETMDKATKERVIAQDQEAGTRMNVEVYKKEVDQQQQKVNEIRNTKMPDLTAYMKENAKLAALNKKRAEAEAALAQLLQSKSNTGDADQPAATATPNPSPNPGPQSPPAQAAA